MEVVGLEATPSVLVKPPRVKASPCALKCRTFQTVQLKDIDGVPAPRFIAFGQVIGIHIEENFIKDSFLDTGAMKPIARAGYQEYFVTAADARFFLKFTEAHKMRAQSHARGTEK